jgi:hypothetical protein
MVRQVSWLARLLVRVENSRWVKNNVSTSPTFWVRTQIGCGTQHRYIQKTMIQLLRICFLETPHDISHEFEFFISMWYIHGQIQDNDVYALCLTGCTKLLVLLMRVWGINTNTAIYVKCYSPYTNQHFCSSRYKDKLQGGKNPDYATTQEGSKYVTVSTDMVERVMYGYSLFKIFFTFL